MKKLFTKKIIIIAVIALSLGANLYLFGNKWLNGERSKYFNSGVMAVRNYIISEIQKSGQVTVANDKGQTMILIPLTEQK